MSKMCKNIARTKSEALQIIRDDLSNQRLKTFRGDGWRRAYGVKTESVSGISCGCGETQGYSGTMVLAGEIFTSYCAVCKHCG